MWKFNCRAWGWIGEPGAVIKKQNQWIVRLDLGAGVLRTFGSIVRGSLGMGMGMMERGERGKNICRGAKAWYTIVGRSECPRMLITVTGVGWYGRNGCRQAVARQFRPSTEDIYIRMWQAGGSVRVEGRSEWMEHKTELGAQWRSGSGEVVVEKEVKTSRGSGEVEVEKHDGDEGGNEGIPIPMR